MVKKGDTIKAFAKHGCIGKGHRDNPFVVTEVCGKGKGLIVYAGEHNLPAKEWNFVIKETK